MACEEMAGFGEKKEEKTFTKPAITIDNTETNQIKSNPIKSINLRTSFVSVIRKKTSTSYNDHSCLKETHTHFDSEEK